MDRERRKHLQTVRLIVTEIIMAVAAVLTVVLLTFIAMGYNVNKDGELGQSGLVQIKSFPSGATVNVDGEDLLGHTSMSRMLAAGDHRIVLSKDKYDTWAKDIKIESGRLIKLEYPRLFLKERKSEKIIDYKAQVAFFVPAPSRESVLVIDEGATKWDLYDMRGSNANKTVLDFSEFLKDAKILSLTWDKNSDSLLAGVSRNDKTEWLLLDVQEPSQSVNLSKEFDLEFSTVEFASDNGDALLALENNNLRVISLRDKTVSQVIASDIVEFSSFDDNLVYLTSKNEVKVHQENKDDELLAKYSKDKQIKIATFEYLDQAYVYVVVDGDAFVYKDDKELVKEEKIGFLPDTLKVYAEGELVMAKKDTNVAMFDAEQMLLSKYELENARAFILDGYMMGTNVEGKLVVQDFDGTNKRTITTASGPAFITKNNKWLYYLNGNSLYREQIMD